jgi:iron(III) transport system permease protein
MAYSSILNIGDFVRRGGSAASAGAFIVTFIVFIPLVGLMLGLLDPIPNPFLGTTPSFTSLLQQTGAQKMLLNTVLIAVAVSVAAVCMGTWLAYMQQRADYPGRKLLSLLCLMPLAMPSYLLAATLRESLGPGGMLGKPLGFPMFTGFWPAFIVLVLTTVPFVQLLVNATLARSSSAEEEAARTLGANHWQVFRHVIVPRLRPSFAFALLIVQLYVISDFGAVAVLDYQVLTWRLYQSVDHQQLQEATLFGVTLLIITLPLLVLSRRIHGAVPRTLQVSNARAPKSKKLSKKALSLTYVIQAFIIGLGVLLPIITLMVWVWMGAKYNNVFASLAQPLADSIWITSVGALFVVVLAFFPAWFTARNKNKASWLVEQMTYLSSALPGVLLAFGLILMALFISRYFDARALYPWLLSSGILLLLGYAMRFLAESYAPLKASILMLDPREKESARLLGASDWQWFKRVALPTLKPGVLTALVLAALAIIKELPVTLLLGGAMGLRPLSFRIFDRYQEAFLHDVGLAGLVLLLFSFTMTLVLLRWRRHV